MGKMGDNVSFKVFLKNDNEQEVRRFVIDKNVSTSYDYLLEKLRVVFPQLQGCVFSVCWTDEDGDHVTITSDEEHGILQRGRLALQSPRGKEWRHWKSSGYPAAYIEVLKKRKSHEIPIYSIFYVFCVEINCL